MLTREQGRALEHDVIVLNSLACISQALPYMDGYGYERMFTWMDNDEAGKNASGVLSEFAKSQQSVCYAMNKLYAGYKDVSEFHSADPRLPQQKVKP